MNARCNAANPRMSVMIASAVAVPATLGWLIAACSATPLLARLLWRLSPRKMPAEEADEADRG